MFSLQVATTEWTPRIVGGSHDTLCHALDCAKRAVRRTGDAVDVWLCGDDGRRRLLLAHLRPGKCTLTGSGAAFKEHLA